MSIIITYPQENNLTESSTPAFQDWGPNVVSHYYFSNVVFSLLIPSLVIFKIKDVIGLPETAQYTEFRLKGYQAYLLGTTIPWITPFTSSGYPQILNNPVPLTANGTTYTFYPSFQNLGALAVGNYDFVHYFFIEGKLASGVWQPVSNFQHTTRLTISDSLVDYSPTSLSYQHTQNTTLPSNDINISGASWTIVARPYFELSSVTPGVTIETITPDTGEPYQTATGSGNAVVTVTLSSYFDTFGQFLPGEPYLSELIVLAGLTQIGTIPITIQIANTGTFFATPNQLSFVAIKGIQEPTPQHVLAFSSDPPYTIACSPWLTAVIGFQEIAGFMMEVIFIVPIPTSNMSVGTYQGTVVLTDTINGTPSSITINVDYDLQGFIQSPYTIGKKAFTLDPLFYQFFTSYPNTYFQITSVIKTFDFFTNQLKQYNISEKLPNFKGKAQLNFGKTIHKLMDRFSTLNQNFYQYKPALFSMLIEEKDIDTGVVIRSAQLTDQEFVAGLSRGITNDVGFLDFNKKAGRVTINSVHILNVLGALNVNYEIRVYQNANHIDTRHLGYTNGSIISTTFNFDDYVQGDIIDIKLFEVGNTVNILATKTFYVIPQQTYSCLVFWEDDFLLQSVLEFTGALNVKTDLEFRTNNLFQNLVELLEYIETTKVNKLTMNTGWLIKTSVDSIESLLRSKRAWVDLNGKRIGLRPISKQIVNEDTERELIEFTIEFQINRNYDQETYTS